MEQLRHIDIAVVGGGAAGMVSAIAAANNRKRVVVFEKGPKLGRKILISGNGRCNVTNIDADSIDHYHSADSDFIQGVIQKFSLDETISFFADLGIELVKEKRGRLFPRSNQAHSIVEVLKDRLKQQNVEIILNCTIKSVEKDRDKFLLKNDEKRLFVAKNVILASGGITAEKVGGNKSGIEIASELGHDISTLLPGLVPLKSPLRFLKRMRGVKTVALVKVKSAKGKKTAEDCDDLFFADYGVSGFTILNLSAQIVPMLKNGNVQLEVNFFPDKTSRELFDILRKRWNCNPHRTLEESFLGLLNSKLTEVLIEESGFDGDKIVGEIDDKECKNICNSLTKWNIPVNEPRGVDYAEVMIGGVRTHSINPQTLESYICPGLYFCGEIIDVHGDLGGYNFQWAWASGTVAGESLNCI